MAIDHKDWLEQIEMARLHGEYALGFHAKPQVQYVTIEQDKVWEEFRAWLKESRKSAEKTLEADLEMLQNNGDYSHEALMKCKVRVDISKGEVLVLSRIEEKVLSYTQEPE